MWIKRNKKRKCKMKWTEIKMKMKMKMKRRLNVVSKRNMERERMKNWKIKWT